MTSITTTTTTITGTACSEPVVKSDSKMAQSNASITHLPSEVTDSLIRVAVLEYELAAERKFRALELSYIETAHAAAIEIAILKNELKHKEHALPCPSDEIVTKTNVQKRVQDLGQDLLGDMSPHGGHSSSGDETIESNDEVVTPSLDKRLQKGETLIDIDIMDLEGVLGAKDWEEPKCIQSHPRNLAVKRMIDPALPLANFRLWDGPAQRNGAMCKQLQQGRKVIPTTLRNFSSRPSPIPREPLADRQTSLFFTLGLGFNPAKHSEDDRKHYRSILVQNLAPGIELPEVLKTLTDVLAEDVKSGVDQNGVESAVLVNTMKLTGGMTARVVFTCAQTAKKIVEGVKTTKGLVLKGRRPVVGIIETPTYPVLAARERRQTSNWNQGRAERDAAKADGGDKDSGFPQVAEFDKGNIAILKAEPLQEIAKSQEPQITSVEVEPTQGVVVSQEPNVTPVKVEPTQEIVMKSTLINEDEIELSENEEHSRVDKTEHTNMEKSDDALLTQGVNAGTVSDIGKDKKISWADEMEEAAEKVVKLQEIDNETKPKIVRGLTASRYAPKLPSF